MDVYVAVSICTKPLVLPRNYPDYGFYLAILGLKTQDPFLQEIWKSLRSNRGF